jgi:hypothetical protein
MHVNYLHDEITNKNYKTQIIHQDDPLFVHIRFTKVMTGFSYMYMYTARPACKFSSSLVTLYCGELKVCILRLKSFTFTITMDISILD